MIFSQAQQREQAKNVRYNEIKTVTNFEGLKEVAKFDHVPVVLGPGKNDRGEEIEHYRADKYFLESDVVGMDIDNSSTENQEQWIDPQKFAEAFKGIHFYYIYSRNHQKPKNNKAPRPKFHVYFPLKNKINTVDEYKTLKKDLIDFYTPFDPECKSATQLFFGVENPDGGEYTGELCIDEFLENVKLEKEKEKQEMSLKILQGERNDALYKSAIGFLMNYTEETARKKYDAEAAKCEPRLGLEEIEVIWNSASKSNLVRAENLALTKIKENDKNFEVAKEAFMNEINKLSLNDDEILNVWQIAVKRTRGGNSEGARVIVKKIPLTTRAVERVLKENEIELKMNVMTQDYEVSGLPENSDFTPEYYSTLSKGKKKRMALSGLFDFLTPILKNLNYSFSENNLKSIVNNIFLAYEYNPVAEMMIEKWDGNDRISELCRILGIEDIPIYCTYLKKWLIQGAAMTFNDEEYPYGNEFVLVLQGAQGIGKTTFFEKLALKPEWFNGGVIVDVNNKDSLIRLDQGFINEIGEYDQTQKKEQSALRDIITRAVSKYRLPYGATDVKRIRHCLFGATVNADKFIRNADGGTRRDAVIKLKRDFSKEIRKLSNDWIIQLWRQAYSLFKENPTYFRLTYEERQEQERRNAEFITDVKGQQDILESLNWQSDQSQWNYKSARQILELANLKYLDAKQAGRALTKIVEQNPQYGIKITRDKKLGTLYFLPPVLDLNNTQLFTDINIEKEENDTPKELMNEINNDINISENDISEMTRKLVVEGYCKWKQDTGKKKVFHDWIKSEGSNHLDDIYMEYEIKDKDKKEKILKDIIQRSKLYIV